MLLGHEIPYKNLKYVTTILVNLYDEEYEAIKESGYNIKKDIEIKSSDALLAVPPYELPSSETPPTTLFTYYNLTNSHAAEFTGLGVKVALIDTGCDDNHLAAAPSVTRHDFSVDQTGVSIEPETHGGRGCIIIGQTNLYTGTPTPGATALYGMAYESDLHSLRVQEDNTAIFSSSIITAIDYCIANSFHIINLSLDGSGGLSTAVNAALAANIIVVCASGNNPANYISHPANIDGVIAVNGWLTEVAGSHLTLDGHTQITAVNFVQGHTSTIGGTSQAAFHLTALLAIYKQKYPTLNTTKAIHLIKNKALQVDGYTYSLKSHTKTKGILENYETGAGFIGPIN